MVNWYAVSLAAVFLYIIPKRKLVTKLLELYPFRSVRKKTAIVILDDIGMNFEKARLLANSGAKIIIGSRDLSKAQLAKRDLIELTRNKYIIVKEANTKNEDSMLNFTSEILRTERYVDMMVNNSGYSMNDLNMDFKKQRVAKERFQNHCLHFMRDINRKEAMGVVKRLPEDL